MILGLTLVDFSYVVRWWGLLFIVGLVFWPFTNSVLSTFKDLGYAFSKIIGVSIISYLVFVLGIFHLAPFTQFNIFLVFILALALNFILIPYIKPRFYFKKIFRIAPYIVLEEILFFLSLVGWALIRAYQPDIHGLEKYMDFGFIDSILRSSYFPPKDMWFTPFSINYYYFGHLITAVLTKASGIPSFVTFNLMVATIFALAFIESFSIGITLFSATTKKHFQIIIAGFFTAILLTLGGNLHTIYTFFKPYQNDNPVPFWQLPFSPSTFPNLYWYPNATRFIHNTIHEFPIYSFVVSDLHGHVLSIPLILCLIALVVHQFTGGEKLSFPKTIFYSFFIALSYMTNAWDGAIYILLLIVALLIFEDAHKESLVTNISKIWLRVVVTFVGLLVFSFPFSLSFKPFVSGVGILCAPEALTNIGRIGPFLFEADHCMRSPLWQLLILYGFFYTWVIFFLVKLWQHRQVSMVEKALIALIITATILIVVPEFIYMKDIYPAHYRANTMFKLTYQAYMMLMIVCGYLIIKAVLNIKLHAKNIWNWLFICIGGTGLLLVLIYPYFAINAYYDNFKTYHGLDGTAYLKIIHPYDYEAILWINQHIPGQPVILEAQGDSYTDYERISANTGLPTVLGWLVHEWLWRGTYSVPAPRIDEVKTLYETTDEETARQLIKKYNISLIYVGNMEREKYPELSEGKFSDLGKIIYQNQEVRLYQLY